MKPQNPCNPVLFVFLGLSSEGFSDILNEYGLGSAVIAFESENQVNDERIKNEVSKAQKVFIQKTYDSSGIIRINYIMSDDYWDLPQLFVKLEKYISMLYPSVIYTDVYWLLDDARAFEGQTPGRLKTMEALKKGLASTQIYILSNLDSNNFYSSPEDIMRTIVLLSMFKDYNPEEYPVAPDASRYNEFVFADNASYEGKHFLTAACRSLVVQRKALKSFLINILLDWNKNEASSFDIDRFAHSEQINLKVVNEEYFYGLAIPTLKGNISGTNKAVVRQLFGERIESVFELYRDNCINLPDIEGFNLALEALPFYEALRVTGLEGGWRLTLSRALDECEKNLQESQKNLQKWQDMQCKINGERRQLSPLHKVEAWPYRLAEEYLEQLLKIHALTLLKQHRQRALALLAEYHETLLGYQQILQASQAALLQDKAALDAEFEAFVPQVSDYFLGLFEEYEAARLKTLQALTDPMILHMRESTFEDYVSKLDEFTEKSLIPALQRPFRELLSYLEKKSKGRLPFLLSEWAIKNRRFGVHLKIGYVGLYSEANVYMPSEIAAALKSNYESHGFGRMNLFADNKAERIDILYQAGSFNMDDLYYKDLYVR